MPWLLWSAVVVAQSPQSWTATGVALQQAGDTVVAEGRDWHARGDAHGVEFLPALGSAAPHNLPLRLELLDHGPGTPVARDGAIVSVHDDVVARHVVRADGLELTFAFAERPAAGGDLVVRLRVDTELPFAGAGRGGLAFVGEHGGVHVGAVTGIDARGRRCAGTLAYADAVLSLRLPADFVATAAYPLLVDPLVSTQAAVSASAVDSEPDLAFDETSQRWLLVWRRTFSAANSEIRGRLAFADGTLQGGFLLVTNMGMVAARPTVTARLGEFWVAWTRAPSAFMLPAVWACKVASTGTVIGGNLIANWAERIDLGCSSFSNVVYLALRSQVGGDDLQMLLWNGTSIVPLTPGAPLVGYSEAIALSHGGAPSSPVLARVQTNSFAIEIAFAGAVTTSTVLATATNPHQSDPGLAVAMTDATHGMVVWDRPESGSNLRRDVYGVPFHLAGPGSTLVFDYPVLALAATPGIDEAAPTIAPLGGKYAIAWTRADANGDLSVCGRDVAPDCTPCSTVWQLDPANTLGSQPVLAARTQALGAPFGEAIVAATQAANWLAGGAIVAQTVVRFAGGTVFEAGPACGFVGTFDTIGGPPALGNPDFTYRLSGFPSPGLTLLDLGFAGGEIACGLCTFTNPIVLEYVAPQTATEVTRTLAIPCQVGLIGQVLSAQWLLLGAASTPCGLVPNLNASRRLHAVIAQ